MLYTNTNLHLTVARRPLLLVGGADDEGLEVGERIVPDHPAQPESRRDPPPRETGGHARGREHAHREGAVHALGHEHLGDLAHRDCLCCVRVRAWLLLGDASGVEVSLARALARCQTISFGTLKIERGGDRAGVRPSVDAKPARPGSRRRGGMGAGAYLGRTVRSLRVTECDRRRAAGPPQKSQSSQLPSINQTRPSPRQEAPSRPVQSARAQGARWSTAITSGPRRRDKCGRDPWVRGYPRSLRAATKAASRPRRASDRDGPARLPFRDSSPLQIPPPSPSLTRRSRPRGSRHASRDAGVGQGGGLPVVARGRVGPGGPPRRDEGRAEDARSIQAGAGAISSHRRHRVHGAVEGAGLRRARAREERGGEEGRGVRSGGRRRQSRARNGHGRLERDRR